MSDSAPLSVASGVVFLLNWAGLAHDLVICWLSAVMLAMLYILLSGLLGKLGSSARPKAHTLFRAEVATSTASVQVVRLRLAATAVHMCFAAALLDIVFFGYHTNFWAMFL